MSERTLTLVISNLTLQEIKELLKHVRGIEQQEPKRVILCLIKGLEQKSVEETEKIIREVYPQAQIAG